ncbi:MAG: hypothetical protein DMG70_30720 [Acidobacteria bacterium]|nr:MAG: hypothetical protein DMG70_30720 [Acidobacteriota bacterium]
MKQVTAVVLSLVLTAIAFAEPQATGAGKTKSTRKKSTNVSAELQQLRQALEAQQLQIQQLSDELKSRDQALQQMQQRLDQSQAVATQAQSKADVAASQASQQEQTVTALKNDVTDLKANAANVAVNLQETQKSFQGTPESPTALRYKGITITPGGFLAAETVWRKRALGADINTPLNSIPMSGASASNISEFYGSGRQSRVSMLAEGKVKNLKLTGYVEGDFLSAGVTSNNNQSNSYTFRQRQAWGQAALDNGLTVAGGQMWSLVMENRKGLEPRQEAFPLQIDAQYIVGMSWTRQYGFRVAKGFNNKAWLGFSVENPQINGLGGQGLPNQVILGAPGSSGGLYNPSATYSFNVAPDFVVKAAFEPGIGHYEVFGVVSQFRDRIYPCFLVSATTSCQGVTGPSARGAFNDMKTGGGVGANARLVVLNKHLELAGHALAGNGIGRYGNAGLPDLTLHPDGTIALIRNYQSLGTIEYHNAKWDLYVYGGGEYDGRRAFLNAAGAGIGYGSPLRKNTGCSTDVGPGTATGGQFPVSSGGFLPTNPTNCDANTRLLLEGSTGFWYRIYNGPKGRLQLGGQYAYVTRNTWSEIGGQPKGIENMLFTSVRYYLP